MQVSKIFGQDIVLSLKSSVADSARLPLLRCRGTVQARQELASQYTKKFIEELDKNCKRNSCSVDNFTNALNNTLGENKINFSVEKLTNPHSAGAIERDFTSHTNMTNICGLNFTDTESAVTGYVFYFPLKNKNTVIKNKCTAIHEVRHFFDYICNPKTINMRSNKLLYETKRLNEFNNIYHSFLNEYPSILPSKIFNMLMKKKINRMPKEDAIDVLQTIRNALKTELNAYGEELNYCKKEPVKNISTIASIWDIMIAMKFKQKLSFAEEMLAEKLKETRNITH